MKPILFNTAMVRAILDGRKTVTRRVVKPQPNNPRFNCVVDPLEFGWYDFVPHGMPEKIHCPYRLNDILYVRETWDSEPVSPGGHFRPNGVLYYKADGDLRPVAWRGNWHPSIHMPRKAARIFLRVTDVRVERLQNINEEDAIKEGCSAGACRITGGPCGIEDDPEEWTAAEHFRDVWDATIKKADLALYSWNANPLVWVIGFERIGKEEALNHAI